MSLLYRVTKEEKYLIFCKEISNYLIQIQDAEGCWLKEADKITSLDQTTEIAIWLNEIGVNLSFLKN